MDPDGLQTLSRRAESSTSQQKREEERKRITFISSCKDSSCRNLLSVTNFSGSHCWKEKTQHQRAQRKNHKQDIWTSGATDSPATMDRSGLSGNPGRGGDRYLYAEDGGLLGLLVLCGRSSGPRLFCPTQPGDKTQHRRLPAGKHSSTSQAGPPAQGHSPLATDRAAQTAAPHLPAGWSLLSLEGDLPAGL